MVIQLSNITNACSRVWIQPRRVAATSVAMRVAEEMSCQIGEDVGYSIRFEDVTSSRTRIKFLTDGLLLREALVDPLLTRYSCVMVDEAHERSLSSDILLGILKKIRRKRADLRIIVSSATLQADDFLRFFAGEGDETSSAPPETNVATIFHISGRMYPVDIHHLKEPTEDYLARAITTIIDVHAQEPPGDILVFLTGADEITTAVQRIADEALTLGPQAQRLSPMPLHAGLPTSQQLSVFEPAASDVRKVILATNIAEASVTIDGVLYVIDCGFVKLRAYDPATGIDSLTAVPVSRAAATQRAGRAGRTKPGKCYRLYTAAGFAALPAATIPEIQRSNLAPVILQLKALGIDNVARFDFLTAPPARLVVRALELLFSLGALDAYAKLTRPLGTRMAELAAVEPMLAKCLLAAPAFGCLPELLSIAAMTSQQQQGSVWVSHDGEHKALALARRAFAADEGDHLTLLNAYQAFVTRGKRDAQWCHRHRLNFKAMTRAVSVRNQLRRYLERFGIDVDESSTTKRSPPELASVAEKVRRCLTAGFFAQAAHMQPDGSFRTVNGGTIMYAHPSSLMYNRKADWVVFHEAMETGSKVYIRDVTKIEKKWLLEYAPDFYSIRS